VLAQTEDELLARNSSRRRESDLRWTELEIYRTSAGYRVVITGRSIVPGEEDRVRTEETPSAEVVVEACAPSGPDGRPRLTWVSRKTLLEAALLDDDLSEALDDWQEAQR
jgi:hypothetical protein